MNLNQPRVINHKWGEIHLDGKQFRDVVVWHSEKYQGSMEWNWSNDGTRHSTGITWAAIEPLLQIAPEYAILSKGVDSKLHVPQEIVNKLESKGIKTYVLTTGEAVKLANIFLRSPVPFGIISLIHSTC